LKPDRLKRFFLPRMTSRRIIRLVAVGTAAYILFGHICIPMRIRGRSMLPTYSARGVACCWTPAYWFSEPQRGDVVVIRMAGREVMMLKRVVAVEGDTVAFRDGVLYVNGEPQKEPYVKHRSREWNLPARKVNEGYIYVVGDNRGMAMEEHVFGRTSEKRIVGVPLW